MLKLCAENLTGSRIAHGFFGRAGGVSKGIFASLNCGPGSGDARADVVENRKRAADALAPGATLLTLYQIHSGDAVAVAAPWAIGEGPKADAMATNLPFEIRPFIRTQDQGSNRTSRRVGHDPAPTLSVKAPLYNGTNFSSR